MSKAWRVEVDGWPEATSIVAAETRSKARYRVFASAGEAGFDLRFVEIRPRRAPEYDGRSEIDRHPITESYLAGEGS